MALLSKGLAAELAHGEPCKILDGTGERPVVTSPLSLVKMEEHQRSNFHSELGRGGMQLLGGGTGWDLVPSDLLVAAAVGMWFPWGLGPLGSFGRLELLGHGSARRGSPSCHQERCCSKAERLCHLSQPSAPRQGSPFPPDALFRFHYSPPRV